MIALVCRDYRDKPRLFDFARRAASVLYSTAYAEFVKMPPRPDASNGEVPARALIRYYLT